MHIMNKAGLQPVSKTSGILGPFLYGMFVSPLFDLTPLFAFADEKQVIDSEINLEALIPNIESKLEMITIQLVADILG